MHGTYTIRIVKAFSREDAICEYAAPTHPQKGDVVYVGNKRYVVSLVSHILTVYDAGSKREHTALDFVELEVL
ncbi:hypothetical protein D3C80_1143330 [compost metagenome]